MKKLKLFLLLFVAAVAACNFTACKDDKDDENSKAALLVGTWISSEGAETLTITFSADGRFVETYSFQGTAESYSGFYTYDGVILTQRYDDGDVYTCTAEIRGNTLVMDGDIYYTKR